MEKNRLNSITVFLPLLLNLFLCKNGTIFKDLNTQVKSRINVLNYEIFKHTEKYREYNKLCIGLLNCSYLAYFNILLYLSQENRS